MTLNCIQDANDLQQHFSHEKQATLFRAVPAFEVIQSAWEAKAKDPRYSQYRSAIQDGLAKLGKYYSRFDDKPVYVLTLGKSGLHSY